MKNDTKCGSSLESALLNCFAFFLQFMYSGKTYKKYIYKRKVYRTVRLMYILYVLCIRHTEHFFELLLGGTSYTTLNQRRRPNTNRN